MTTETEIPEQPPFELSDEVRSYLRFAAMIGTSMVAMFAVMYLNTYELGHVRWSETRFYMTLLMASTMAVIMLAYMLGMYKNTVANIVILGTSVLVFALALILVRSQETVEDASYMSAMIPHHSIAILTSERACIEDVRVRELADSIITAQRKEIAEMEWLLNDINENGKATSESAAQDRPVPEFDGSPQEVHECSEASTP